MKKIKKHVWLAITFVIAGLLLTVSATAVKEVQKPEDKKNGLNTTIAGHMTLTPAAVKNIAKTTMKTMKTKPMPLGIDTQVTPNPLTDQNPALVTDGIGDFLSLYEIEIDESEFDIGISNYASGGDVWSDQYQFEVDGNPVQPRLDFYQGKTAYGTWTADPWEALGFAYFAVFPDITDPEAGEDGWVYYSVEWGTNDIGVPFTSADVACYPTDNPPTEAWWGIIGFTGDNDYSGYEEDNTFMFQYDTEEGYVTIIFFYNLDQDVYNIATDIDQSTARFYMVADYVNETDPSQYGTMVLVSPEITSDEEWWQGDWPGVLFNYCSHPQVDTSNGRVYITTELTTEDNSKDIVCWTTTTPDNWESWEAYTVTETPGEDEANPVITAYSDTNAAIILTKDNDLYISRTTDSAQTWSTPEQINDNTGSVVEQYGCTDITGNYLVWTDDREGNSDIYFDVGGNPPTAPSITGPSKGKPNKEYSFTFKSTDPEGSNIYYYVDWGDGTYTDWDGPHASGEEVTLSHTWSTKEGFTIKAKAKNTAGIESLWSMHSFSTPRSRTMIIWNILENHPRIQNLLQILFH